MLCSCDALTILKQKWLETRKTFNNVFTEPAGIGCPLALSGKTGLTEPECAMKKLTANAPREIIKDFAKAIRERREGGPQPSQDLIDFRNDRKAQKPRDVWFVPLELLRYRKENGRITSDVLSYERTHGRLDDTTVEGQEIIRKFLEEKDVKKTEELKKAIEHDQQRESAIVTCDGFLINGNRRKMVLEMINREAGAPKFPTMKVVILPGEGEEGGPPTLVEIEEIENRYQLQSEGKAEYYAFDKALSIQRKIQCGMSLEQQLQDDPQYSHLNPKDFKRAVETVWSEYLGPLECIDRYLEWLNRDGLYSTVSSGLGDPEGRWQAFHDYYQSFYRKSQDSKLLLQMNLREDEVGKVEQAAFRIIRKRDLGKIGKVHSVMRELPNLLKKNEAKREFLKIHQIKSDLPNNKRFDVEGKEHDERTIDKFWGEANQQEIFHHLNTALMLEESKSELEKPLDLLQAALDKLQHKKMDPRAVWACFDKTDREVESYG